MTMCSVKWCAALAAPGLAVCPVHRKHPNLHPSTLAADEEAVDRADCEECDGSGDCDACLGTGECVCEGSGNCTHCDGEGEVNHKKKAEATA